MYYAGFADEVLNKCEKKQKNMEQSLKVYI